MITTSLSHELTDTGTIPDFSVDFQVMRVRKMA